MDNDAANPDPQPNREVRYIQVWSCMICDHHRFEHNEKGCGILGCTCKKTNTLKPGSLDDHLTE